MRIGDPTKRLACFDRVGNSKQTRTQTSSDETKIQEAVRRSLKDPTSALFGTLTLVPPNGACQTVNARNEFGGYTGNQQAVVVKMNGLWQPIEAYKMSHEECISAVKKLSVNSRTDSE